MRALQEMRKLGKLTSPPRYGHTMRKQIAPAPAKPARMKKLTMKLFHRIRFMAGSASQGFSYSPRRRYVLNLCLALTSGNDETRLELSSSMDRDTRGDASGHGDEDAEFSWCALTTLSVLRWTAAVLDSPDMVADGVSGRCKSVA